MSDYIVPAWMDPRDPGLLYLNLPKRKTVLPKQEDLVRAIHEWVVEGDLASYIERLRSTESWKTWKADHEIAAYPIQSIGAFENFENLPLGLSALMKIPWSEFEELGEGSEVVQEELVGPAIQLLSSALRDVSMPVPGELKLMDVGSLDGAFAIAYVEDENRKSRISDERKRAWLNEEDKRYSSKRGDPLWSPEDARHDLEKYAEETARDWVGVGDWVELSEEDLEAL